MLYVGIDWADSGSVVAAMDRDGTVLRKLKVEQSLEGYERMLAEMSQLESDRRKVAFGIESPHHPLMHFLVEKGYTGYAPNPKSVDRAREIESPSGKKDDFFDAVTIANMVRVDRGKLRPYTPDTPATVKLRILCDAHRSLVEARTAYINQIAHCLKAYWPDALELFSRLDGKVAMKFFARWPDPVSAGRARRQSVIGFLKNHGYTYPRRIEKIMAILRRPPLPVAEAVREAKSLQLSQLLPQFAVVCSQADACEKQIAKRFDVHPDAHIFRSLLISKDSNSRILVARLLCDFGDRRDRYASRKELLALAGVAPVTYETGNGKLRVIKMRRACRKNFRNDVHHLADLYRRHYYWAEAIYQAHRDENSGHNTALRALGGVLLKITYGMWKNRSEFDPDIYLARRGEQLLRQSAHPVKSKKKGRQTANPTLLLVRSSIKGQDQFC